jgi:hypothetical protein
MPQIQGIVEIQNDGGSSTEITLDGNTGKVTANGLTAGLLTTRTASGTYTFEVLGPTGTLHLRDSTGATRVTIEGQNGDLVVGRNVTIGGSGQAGGLIIRNSSGTNKVMVDGPTGTITLADPAGTPRVKIEGQNGDITIYRGTEQVLHLDATDDSSGTPWPASLHLGAKNAPGNLVIHDSSGTEALRFEAHGAYLTIGGKTWGGHLSVKDTTGKHSAGMSAAGAGSIGATDLLNVGDTIRASAFDASVYVGGKKPRAGYW